MARSVAAASIAAVLLAAGALAGCGAGEDVVGAQLVDGHLRLTFDKACPVGVLRLDPPDLPTGEPAAVWWEIRAAGGARAVKSVTAGTPPAGFEEVADASGGQLPAELTLTLHASGTHAATIVTADLNDGASHRYDLHPVMIEAAPGNRC